MKITYIFQLPIYDILYQVRSHYRLLGFFKRGRFNLIYKYTGVHTSIFGLYGRR